MILLTGAAGYLGRFVSAKLEAQGLPYMATSWSGAVGIACDLTDAADVQELLLRVNPTIIIHCAAKAPKSPVDYENYSGALGSTHMVINLVVHAKCPIVFASSHVAAKPHSSLYASSKQVSECVVMARKNAADTILRIPGLFGLPRRSGVIYESAVKGEIKDSYGPSPAMHVQDAAEYLVRSATMPSDGNPEPYTVTYGNERLERVYGSLGVTFQQRVQELVEQVKA